jgi:hypothetical protein
VEDFQRWIVGNARHFLDILHRRWTSNRAPLLDGTNSEAKAAAGFLINQGVVFTNNRQKIVALAARHKIPAIYPFRQYVVDGGPL